MMSNSSITDGGLESLEAERTMLLQTVLETYSECKRALEESTLTDQEVIDEVATLLGFDRLLDPEIEKEYHISHPKATKEQAAADLKELGKAHLSEYLNPKLSLSQAAKNFTQIAASFLGKLIKYIENNRDEIDIFVLKELAKGINSATIDVRRFPTEEQFNEAKKIGIRTDIQRAVDLGDEISKLTASAVGLNQLMSKIGGDPARIDKLIEIFLKRDDNYPMTPEGFQQAYLEYKAIMKEIGSNIPIIQSADIIGRYALSMQYISHAVTRKQVDELLPNVFYILSSFLTIVIMESMTDPDEQ